MVEKDTPIIRGGAKLGGGKPEKAIPTACAIEMIHSILCPWWLPAMDNDNFRRGKPTFHNFFDEAIAILAGDALLTAAFELMSQNKSIDGIAPANLIRVIREEAQAAGSQGMIGWQVLDLNSEGQVISGQELKELHGLKTGQLFTTALRAGAILAGLGEIEIESLSSYARHFGLAFQITDDILDVQGDQMLTGKPLGSDAKNARTTYISLYGVEGAQKLAGQSVEACIDSLASFKGEAEFLCNLARFILCRTA